MNFNTNLETNGYLLPSSTDELKIMTLSNSDDGTTFPLLLEIDFFNFNGLIFFSGGFSLRNYDYDNFSSYKSAGGTNPTGDATYDSYIPKNGMEYGFSLPSNSVLAPSNFVTTSNSLYIGNIVSGSTSKTIKGLIGVNGNDTLLNILIGIPSQVVSDLSSTQTESSYSFKGNFSGWYPSAVLWRENNKEDLSSQLKTLKIANDYPIKINQIGTNNAIFMPVFNSSGVNNTSNKALVINATTDKIGLVLYSGAWSDNMTLENCRDYSFSIQCGKICYISLLFYLSSSTSVSTSSSNILDGTFSGFNILNDGRCVTNFDLSGDVGIMVTFMNEGTIRTRYPHPASSTATLSSGEEKYFRMNFIGILGD